MPELAYNSALAKMRRGARLLKIHGKSLVSFYVEPGSAVAGDTAAKLIDHPNVYSEHDGLPPDCDQSWRWIGNATPIKFFMHNKCRNCGSNRATSIGDGHLHCASCRADRGKLSDLTKNFIAKAIETFDPLDRPVVLRPKEENCK
jgi:hypothetical protein